MRTERVRQPLAGFPSRHFLCKLRRIEFEKHRGKRLINSDEISHKVFSAPDWKFNFRNCDLESICPRLLLCGPLVKGTLHPKIPCLECCLSVDSFDVSCLVLEISALEISD